MDTQYTEALHSLQALAIMGAIDVKALPGVDTKRAPTISPRRVLELLFEYGNLNNEQLNTIRTQSLQQYTNA